MNARPFAGQQKTVTAQSITDFLHARHRSWVDAHAYITKTETVDLDSGPSFRCVLEDGTGQLDLLFLGRHHVAGLTVGTGCQVSGRVALRAGRPVLWNPSYQIDPRPESHACPMPALADDKRQCLRPISGEESATATGYFEVYVGMAAGVGKTYAMLSEARRRIDEGCDVVVGFVTTHDRPHTESLLHDLEVVAPKIVDYHGAQFEEMDVDAILARRPGIALVDELAHSNIPGSGRNAKRWQDVLELLEAGVHVITTVNVQHVQSLADAAEQITATRVRERIPDAVLRRADNIELVDSSPEQLRRRMRNGNIYPPERVELALDGFFSSENLSALRDLALGFLAGGADANQPALPRRYQPAAQHGAETVLVGVNAAPGTDVVLRRAAQIADRLKADLHVAHIAPTWNRQRADPPTLGALHELADRLGARWIRTEGDDPVTALMELARERQVTQIVVGPSRRNRWQEFFGGGSTVRRLTRLAGKAGMDVHIVVRAAEQTGPDIGEALSVSPARGGRAGQGTIG